MRYKKNPTRLPYSDELLAHKSVVQQSSTEVSPKLNGVCSSLIHIKKSNKLTAITNIKQQKKLKLQNYRDKLLADPKKSNAVLDECDERLIDFLRKCNEFEEKQKAEAYGTSPCETESSYSSCKKTKLSKLQRVMKDLECTMVQDNSLSAVANIAKSKKLEAARRGILKTKKINLLRNYRQLKRHVDEMEEDKEEDEEREKCEIQVGSLDEFKLKLINSVIDKDEIEENISIKKNIKEKKEEDTPISVLIKSNELLMMKTNGLSHEDEAVTQEEDVNIEEEIVDEAIRKKIAKQLHIDVTDKYNFVKQTARTKLRPKCTPDFEMNKRFRKNRYRGVKSIKFKKTVLSENACGQNNFLGFDKSIKRFKDEKRVSSERCLVNKSYFNLDNYTVAPHVETIITPSPQCQNLTTVGFKDEIEFLQYSLVQKKSQSTLDARLRQRLEMWLKMCKTRKDLQRKSNDTNFYLVENDNCPQLNCDNTSELIDCDSKAVMLSVPNGLCPYLEVNEENVESWRSRLNKKNTQNEREGTKAFKNEMRNFIKRMILEKQLRCNSTYAAYDISKQDATNLYEDEKKANIETIDSQEDHDTSISSCKTSRISYYTSGNYVNVSVNLTTPIKRRMSDLIDSENASLASSCDQLPQAHIAKIEEMFTDSNDTDCVGVCNGNQETPMTIDLTEIDSQDAIELGDDITANSSSDSVQYEPQITANLTRDLLISNKAEHNGLISSFLDYGNGQNTKRKKKKFKARISKLKPSRQLNSKRKGNASRSQDKQDTPEWGKSSEGDSGDQVLFLQQPRRSDTSIDLSSESNSNSYESMYDKIKSKTRHISKSIFNFENCKFLRKDDDVFYTSLSINTRSIPVLSLYQKTKPIPDFISHSHLSEWKSLLKTKSLKLEKFTKLKIFVIYVKNVYFVIFSSTR